MFERDIPKGCLPLMPSQLEDGLKSGSQTTRHCIPKTNTIVVTYATGSFAMIADRYKTIA